MHSSKKSLVGVKCSSWNLTPNIFMNVANWTFMIYCTSTTLTKNSSSIFWPSSSFTIWMITGPRVAGYPGLKCVITFVTDSFLTFEVSSGQVCKLILWPEYRRKFCFAMKKFSVQLRMMLKATFYSQEVGYDPSYEIQPKHFYHINTSEWKREGTGYICKGTVALVVLIAFPWVFLMFTMYFIEFIV